MKKIEGPQGRQSYEDWYNSLPKEKQGEVDYNLRRAYELAPQEELDAFASDPNAHLHSAYYDPEKDEYEFMKRKGHPTLQEELDWYYSDKEDAREFRKEFYLDDSGEFYRYKRKRKIKTPEDKAAESRSVLDDVIERRNRRQL